VPFHFSFCLRQQLFSPAKKFLQSVAFFVVLCYNLYMKGFLTTILSACLLFASVRGTADMLSARAESRTNPTAQPEIQSSESDSLILPSSYEQYLPLDAPTGVAVCRNYTAVSDGNVIYVYDRADGEYRLYRHEENRSVTNLQFSADGESWADQTAMKQEHGDLFKWQYAELAVFFRRRSRLIYARSRNARADAHGDFVQLFRSFLRKRKRCALVFHRFGRSGSDL